MSRALRVALGVAGALQLLAVVACALLVIWGGDDRWASTGFLLFVTGAVTIGAATFPGMP